VKSSNKEETGATPDVKRLTTNPSNPQDIKNFLSWNKKQSRLSEFTHRLIQAHSHKASWVFPREDVPREGGGRYSLIWAI